METIKTSIDVHKDVHQENNLLSIIDNGKDFKYKGYFLSDIGFRNSISTKMYKDIGNYEMAIKDFNHRYKGKFLILTDSQLERVCERYDLYVRDLDYYIASIPEKNIQDMIDFRVEAKYLYINQTGNLAQMTMPDRALLLHQQHGRNLRDIEVNMHGRQSVEVGLKSISYIDKNLVQIACVKSKLSDKAFEKSNQRIIGIDEIYPLNKVEDDPIILVRAFFGWIVVTAWGDEINRELSC